jgi:hypothetical protein
VDSNWLRPDSMRSKLMVLAWNRQSASHEKPDTMVGLSLPQ